MRKTVLLLVVLSFILGSCTQSGTDKQVKELMTKIDSLTIKVDQLTKLNTVIEEEYTWIQNELMELKKTGGTKEEIPLASPSPAVKTVKKDAVVVKEKPDVQCQAITSSGKRCSREALKDSKYCYQHKQTYEPEIPQK